MQFWMSVISALRASDIVVEVLDARLPELSRSKDIETLVEKYGKRLLFVLNKSDLVSREDLERTKEELGHDVCLFVSGKNNLGMKMLKEKLMIWGKEMKIDEPRICFVGYPNVGKSSVINALGKRAKAQVSPIAGTTKGLQWISVSYLKVLDSPGVIPVDIRDEARIALLSARDPEKLKNPQRAALHLIQYLKFYHKKALCKFYGIEPLLDENDLFLAIAAKKNFLLKKGELDLRRTALTILRDWQRGKISLMD
jgi:ribosome biogenesis GTPase A